jgi:hypothetical protein
VRESALTACRSASWRFVSSTTDILILINLANALLQVRNNYQPKQKMSQLASEQPIDEELQLALTPEIALPSHSL